jgi:hypothetical protein
MSPKRTQVIYQLNVALQESSALIWRRIQVPGDMTLPRLHRTLQIVMGWEDYHLHEFRINGKAYGEPDPEDHHFGREVADERRVRLATVLSAAGSSFEYIYDFGDNWRHDILIEAILPVRPRKRYPVCMEGARSAPPEDVGGIGGYERYLEALFDPKHEDHRTMLEWRGRFDPEYFPITSVNRKLGEEFPASRNPKSPTMSSPKAKLAPAALELDEIFRSLTHSGRFPRKERTVVGPDDRIPLALSARDRELIVERSLAEEELTERLRLAPNAGKSSIFHFTLGELEDLIGYVAAEANHSDKKAQKEWDVLYDRIAATLDNYMRNESEK